MRRAALLVISAALLAASPALAAEANFALDLEGTMGTPYDVLCDVTHADGTTARLVYAGGPPRLYEFQATTAHCHIFKEPSVGVLTAQLLMEKSLVASTSLGEGPGEAILASGGAAPEGK